MTEQVNKQTASRQEKSLSFIGFIISVIKDLHIIIKDMWHWLRNAKQNIPLIREKLDDLPDTNYNLALDHLENGAFNDAMLRLRIVIKLEPDHFMAHYNLGICLLQSGNKEKAIESLREALRLQPGMPEALFMLSMIGEQDAQPDHIPLSILKHHFETLAPAYDIRYVENMAYTGVTMMRNQLAKVLDSTRAYHAVELGCGTGNCGTALRHRFDYLRGVDIAPSMLDFARKKVKNNAPAYDSLVNVNIQEYLSKEQAESCDLVYASGVCNYLGRLDYLFSDSARILKSGGILAISVETFTGTGFILTHGIGRFKHSLDYLRKLARISNFVEIDIAESEIYRDVPGAQCAFRKA